MQAVTDWEWVIVPNGECGNLSEQILADPRVRVIPYQGETSGVIGALKRFACRHCTGEYIVELDHDDLLAPDALEAVAAAISSEQRPEFLFSDFVEFRHDWTSRSYQSKFGWESYPAEIFGHKLEAMRAFQPSAASLNQIFYAPNHIRIWRRDFYERIGGHEETMEVCDDQDLVIRTYLAGGRMCHIPKPLYLYRLLETGKNTYLEHNKLIQDKQQQVANKYFYKLVKEECRRKDLAMIDLGGGHDSPSGYISVDIINGDICADLRHGLPFADNSVGVVRAYDFLEHIPHCPDSTCKHGKEDSLLCVVGLMNEIYRVLVPGGWLLSRTPSTDGRGAFQDPTHCSFWNPNSFWYYTKKEQAKYVPGVECRFQGARIWQSYPSEWHEKHKILYVFGDLVALKGQRQPGLSEI